MKVFTFCLTSSFCKSIPIRPEARISLNIPGKKSPIASKILPKKLFSFSSFGLAPTCVGVFDLPPSFVNLFSYDDSLSPDYIKNISALEAAVPPWSLTNLVIFCLIKFISLAIIGNDSEFFAAILE